MFKVKSLVHVELSFRGRPLEPQLEILPRTRSIFHRVLQWELGINGTNGLGKNQPGNKKPIKQN
jgi:hypothetical protein